MHWRVEERCIHMNKKLRRILWVIPNICFYLIVIFLSIWVAINIDRLEPINRLDLFVFMIILILGVSLLGTYRIIYWIRTGQLYEEMMISGRILN